MVLYSAAYWIRVVSKLINQYASELMILTKMLKVLYSHKKKQLKAATKKQMGEHKKELQKERRKLKRHKELRKQVFRTLSKRYMKNKRKLRR